MYSERNNSEADNIISWKLIYNYKQTLNDYSFMTNDVTMITQIIYLQTLTVVGSVFTTDRNVQPGKKLDAVDGAS